MPTALDFLEEEAPAKVSADDFLSEEKPDAYAPFTGRGVTSPPTIQNPVPIAPTPAPQPGIMAKVGQALDIPVDIAGNILRGAYNFPAQITHAYEPLRKGESPLPDWVIDAAKSTAEYAARPGGATATIPPKTPFSEAAGNVAGKTLTSLTTPESLATLPFFEFKAVRAAMLASQIAKTPEQVSTIAKTFKDPKATPEQKWEALGDAGVNLAMTAGLALSLKPAEVRAKFTPEEAAKIAEPKPTAKTQPGVEQTTAPTTPVASTTEVPNAKGIRENQGQPETTGQVVQGGEANRGGDVQQATPAPPEPLDTREEKGSEIPLKEGEEINGWTFKPVSSVNVEGAPPELAAQLKEANKGKEWEVTDRRKSSPTEGLTTYVPEGSTREQIAKAIQDKVDSIEKLPTPPVDQTVNKPVQRYKIGKSPQTFVEIDRPKASEIEIANGEQPVRVKNEKTGEVQTVKESDLAAVKTLDKKAKGKKVETPVAVQSLGGQNPADPGEIPKSELAQVTDAVKGLAQKPGNQAPKAFDIGKSLSSLKDTTSQAIGGLKAVGAYLKTKLEGKPIFDSWKAILGDRHLALSESAINARKFAKEAAKAFPNKVDQEAISNWIDHGGDEASLRKALAETPDRYKPGYEKALKLTSEQKTFAKNLQNYFEARLQDAQEAGILEDGIENYIHRMYEKENPWKQCVIAELRSGIFTGKPALAKQRVFQYDFEAEKAGLKPVKSFIKRVAAYDLSLNKAIADRAAVKAMMELKMTDGRPMLDVAGIGSKIEAPDGTTEATLIRPSFKPEDEANPKNNRGDFKHYDYPALRKWKWIGKDDKGNPIYLQGDVLVHPEAIPRIKALFEKSAIRQNPVGRAALNIGSTVKQTMLSLSGFHPVQIGVHGFEHRTFKPVKEIDFTNPDVRGLVRGGLVVGETTGRELFDEGLAGSSLTKHIPWLGPKLEAYNDWLFNSYIPRLKVATGLHALERNKARFPNLSPDALNHLTANQMNNAFGELNYAMLGRSQTMQDVLRIALLAPDFLEARSGFVGQAATKFGREQLVALAYGAGALYLTARVLNQALSGQPHMEPKNAFNVVYNGKAYSLRTIQGDLIHAATDFPSFVRNRLNPVWGRSLMEAATGRDTFGRKRTAAQQAGDVANTAIPISTKGLFSGREQNLMESLMNAFGVTEHRESPMEDIYQKVQAWKKENKIGSEPGEFIYDADKDPFRQIRLAAQYSDVAAVRGEISKAVANGESKSKIEKHFRDMSNRPITGSHDHETAFVKTLSADDKKTYEAAKEERRKINQAVSAAAK